MRSILLAVVVNVGAVPPTKSQYDPYAKVLLPVPSCVIKIEPDCPAVKLEGLARVRFPARVTLKLLEFAKSGVMVEPSVNAVISPRCPLVKVCAVSSEASPAAAHVNPPAFPDCYDKKFPLLPEFEICKLSSSTLSLLICSRSIDHAPYCSYEKTSSPILAAVTQSAERCAVSMLKST